jgi:dTDP-4-dehydrorhamnose 3,5-epimerase
MTAGPTPGADTPSVMAGVSYGHLVSHGDLRGSFTELWRASHRHAGDAPFVQANLSTSARGVLRGLHFHQRQLDYWVVLEGRAFVALVDARGPVSGTSAVPAVETRELGRYDWVVIPAGVAHGFLALEPTRLLYLVSNEYDGTDELGFAWDDPAVGVPWPRVPGTSDQRPIVSPRDASNPTFNELVDRLRN